MRQTLANGADFAQGNGQGAEQWAQETSEVIKNAAETWADREARNRQIRSGEILQKSELGQELAQAVKGVWETVDETMKKVEPLAKDMKANKKALKKEYMKSMAEFGREREQSELRQAIAKDVDQSVRDLSQGMQKLERQINENVMSEKMVAIQAGQRLEKEGRQFGEEQEKYMRELQQAVAQGMQEMMMGWSSMMRDMDQASYETQRDAMQAW